MKRKNEVLVGILTIAAVAILIVGTYWLSRGSFRGGYELYTETPWGPSLKTGQRVLFAGVSIGYVEHVQLLRQGKLVITLVIERDYEIPYGSTASVQSVGLFGDMIVAIDPGSDTTRFLATGDTIPPGKGGATPGDIIAGADSVTRTLQALLEGIHREIVDAGAITELRNTFRSINRLAERMTEVVAAQSAELSATMGTLRRTVASVDSARIDSTLRSFQMASANVEQLTASLDSSARVLSNIATRLEQGEGTAGKLLSDPALYDDLRGAVGNLTSLLDDFKANPRKYLGFTFSIFGGRR
jgi:phospholipid/cholesterol/gamma-HCH transport system substrate-binding protein